MPARLFGRLPISVKLPIIMGGLMLLMHGAMSVLALVEARALLMREAGERLIRVSARFSLMLEQQAASLASRAELRARQDAMRAYLENPGRRTADAANDALIYRGPEPNSVPASELWDRDARVVLASSHVAELSEAPRHALAELPGPGNAPAVGPLIPLGDSIVIPLVIPIVSAGTRVGYLVEWRFFGGSEATRESMSALIGSAAEVYIGGPGGAWTDLARRVAAPPLAVPPGAAPVSYERPGAGEQVAASALVAGTPWQVVVEFPREVIMRPVGAIMRRRLLLVSTILIIGLAAAWAASIYITRELNRTLAMLRDTQEELVRKERLALLGQLSSGVGHELRNPLGVMTNAVYYLDAVTGNASPTVKEYLGILRTQIALSERIVGDLLDFARVRPPQRELVSVSELADAQLARLGETPGVEIRRDYAAGTPSASVDLVQMGQVVLNLLTNATQAMGDKGGVLTLRAGPDGAGRVQLEVADTGPGIPPEHLAMIFEPLFTTKARGIGLGLAVSRALATNNDSELTVASTPGHGATFTLRVPLGAPAGSAA